MSWDWHKALQIVNPSAAATAVTGVASAGKATSSSKGQQECPGANSRPSSIVWRTAGQGSLRSSWSCEVPLLTEKEYDCPFCRGRGDLASGGVCPICNGGTKVRVEPPAVKCAFCNGQGQMPPRSNMSCWVCKGKGIVSVTAPIQTCPDCLGRGKKPCASLYCARCRGVGVVAAHNWP
jgi:DnaJ-class molecular chaperone